jgi:NADH-quinone oxidoreductase subunit N
MSAYNIIQIMPLLIVAVAAIAAMLAIAFKRSHRLVYLLATGGIIYSWLTIPLVFSQSPLLHQITPLLIMDNYALFFMGLLLAASAAVIVLSYGYLPGKTDFPEEYYILLLLATLGAMILAASSHFASLFLGLEILSLSLYALIAYPRTRGRHLEASIKYLILSTFSASFLVFGMALIYAREGTMTLSDMAVLLSVSDKDPVVLTGTAMVMVGIGFKLAVVPFHMWTPDIYEGAPAPVTAFIATVSKGAVFALLLRYFEDVEMPGNGALFIVFSFMAAASMFVGNLLALFQQNLKRLLAYSSIAHFGYLLVAFLALNPLQVTAVAFYLVAYFISTVGAFGVVTILSGPERDADRITDYQGLFNDRPWLAVALTLMLLSLAGIPMTVGFMGKFFVVAAGMESSRQWLVAILVINSAIGIFYYLRVISVIFAPPLIGGDKAHTKLASAGTLVIIVLVALLAWWGIYPGSLTHIIQKIFSGI